MSCLIWVSLVEKKKGHFCCVVNWFFGSNLKNNSIMWTVIVKMTLLEVSTMWAQKMCSQFWWIKDKRGVGTKDTAICFSSLRNCNNGLMAQVLHITSWISCKHYIYKVVYVLYIKREDYKQNVNLVFQH